MKKCYLFIIFLIVQSVVYSQNVFNKIFEDTTANIMNSVVSLDTGYVYITGTGNINGVRCYSINYIDNYGNKVWKKLPPNDINQIWEGWDDNFQSHSDNEYSLSGNYTSTVANQTGVHLTTFDSLFNIKDFNTFLTDTIDRRIFHHIISESKDYYLTGQIYDYIQGEEYRLYLVKLDSSANVIWEKEYGNHIYEYGSSIIETEMGTILTGGSTWLFDITKTKWYLLNTDTSGNIIWEREFGRNNYNNGKIKGLIETNDSSYLVCGSYPVAKYGTGSGITLWDGCLRKVSSDGDLLWTKYYRTFSKYTSAEQPIKMLNNINSMFEDSSGNIFIVGTTYSSKPFYRGYLSKLNKTGDILFHRQYYAIDEFSNQQYLNVLKPTSDGGFILAGYGNAYDWYGYDPPQQSWLVKTDSMGLDGLSNVELPELNIDLDLPESVCIGDTISVYAYISGKSAPYTIEISTGQVIDSIYYPPTFVPIEIGLTHVDLEWGGSTYFQQTITEATLTNHEWGQCIARPIDFYTPLTADTHEIYITVTDAYGESTTITKEINVIDCGVDKLEDNLQTICSVYPNPASDKIYVNIPNLVTSTPLSHQACALEIINNAGSIVYRHEILSLETELNIKDLLPGNYTIRIYTGDKIEHLRFEKL